MMKGEYDQSAFYICKKTAPWNPLKTVSKGGGARGDKKHDWIWSKYTISMYMEL
jgi:hypothetical protein